MYLGQQYHHVVHEWMNEEESWMRGQQTCPLTIHLNMWTVSSDVSIQRRHWQPLSVHLWAYCTHPWCEWCDEWRLTTTPGSTSLTLFKQWCGFFYVPQEPDKCRCCWTGPMVFRPYPRTLESQTDCRCHYKGSTFFSVIYRPWVLVQPGFELVTSRYVHNVQYNLHNPKSVLKEKT